MAINLPDLRTAVSTYISGSVSTSVSAPVADVPAAISPGEEFTFSVEAKNAAFPTGIRLVNVRYHVSISPSTRAQLKVPASPPARSSSDPTSPVLAPGSFVSNMFLFPVDGALDVGDTDTVAGLKGKALALGAASVTFHVHADADLEFLFPKGSTGGSGSRAINIV